VVQGSEAACVEEAAGDVTGEAAEFSGCSSEVFQVTLSVSTIPVMQRWSTTIIVTANVIASRESFALPGGYRGVRPEGEWHGGNAAPLPEPWWVSIHEGYAPTGATPRHGGSSAGCNPIRPR